MLTEAQQQQYIHFVAEFVKSLRRDPTISREQAEKLLVLAVSVLMATVFEALSPDGSTEPDPFIIGAMRAALDYGYKAKVVD